MDHMNMSLDELREQHRMLLARYASMEEAADANQKEAHRLGGQVATLKNEVIRLGGEARAAQQNAQLLGDDFNERNRASGTEETRLRELLIANGINPDG
jgi:chromosome segregation ATPase